MNLINKTHDVWAVFPTYYYNQNWQNAVSQYSTNLIAVHSNDAHSKGVITAPNDWEYNETWKVTTIKPICPQGYTASSTYVHYSGAEDLSETWKDSTKHVHCLKNEYWLSQSEAKAKYGIETVDTGHPQEYCSGCQYDHTEKQYMTIPLQFHYSGQFAEFDMGKTADILYPAHHNHESTSDQKLIDFAHSHFYFWDTCKNFSEATNHFA